MGFIPDLVGSKEAAQARFIPVDESLPGLGDLCNPTHVAQLLKDRGVNAIDYASARIVYLRYKPATSCIVLYAFDQIDSALPSVLIYGKCFTPDNFTAAHAKATTAQKPAGLTEAALVAVPEWSTLFYRFPFDAELSGLEILAEPKKVQRLIYELVDDFPGDLWRISDRKLHSTVIRYKPEKRAVIRVDTRAVHRDSKAREDLRLYLRTYHDHRGRVAHEFMTDLYTQVQAVPGLRVPRSYGYVPDRHLLIMESVPGASILTDLSDEEGSDALRLTAGALAGFHRCRPGHVQHRTLATALQDARSTGGLLKHVWPDYSSRLESVLTQLLRLADSLPHEVVQLVHGDFYYGQVLRAGRHVSLIDFDRTFLGDAVADLGNFAAHLRLLELEGKLTNSAARSQQFVAFYKDAAGASVDPRRYAFWLALGLFELSVRPFRALRAGWREQVDGILTECETVLS